jgi:hypothetical protein
MFFGSQHVYGFEIGVVYRNKDKRFFLAVDKDLLITFVHGAIVECSPTVKPSVARNINVERLCECWGITLDDLDVMSAEYFSPIKNSKPKRRLPDKFGAKKNYSQDALNSIWAMHRTHRVVGVE